MTNIVIPEALRQSLPHDFDVERATVTTYGALSKAHDVSGYEGMKIADVGIDRRVHTVEINADGSAALV